MNPYLIQSIPLFGACSESLNLNQGLDFLRMCGLKLPPGLLLISPKTTRILRLFFFFFFFSVKNLLITRNQTNPLGLHCVQQILSIPVQNLNLIELLYCIHSLRGMQLKTTPGHGRVYRSVAYSPFSELNTSKIKKPTELVLCSLNSSCSVLQTVQ